VVEKEEEEGGRVEMGRCRRKRRKRRGEEGRWKKREGSRGV
jgi:hypothetical protein